jgi:hypothetical protein
MAYTHKAHTDAHTKTGRRILVVRITDVSPLQQTQTKDTLTLIHTYTHQNRPAQASGSNTGGSSPQQTPRSHPTSFVQPLKISQPSIRVYPPLY